MPQKDYVLGRFAEEQRIRLNPALDRAAEALLLWTEKGITPAMNRFNAEEEKREQETGDRSQNTVERKERPPFAQ